MKKVEKKKANRNKGAVINAVILVTFIIAAIYVVRYTSVKEFLTKE